MASEVAAIILIMGVCGGVLCYFISTAFGPWGTLALGILGLLITAYIINEVITRMDTIISLMQGGEEEDAEYE